MLGEIRYINLLSPYDLFSHYMPIEQLNGTVCKISIGRRVCDHDDGCALAVHG